MDFQRIGQAPRTLQDIRQTEQELRFAQERQRNILAIKRCFSTEDGQLVLRHLKKKFHVEQSAWMPIRTPDGGFRYDDTHAKLRDGQRNVILYILDMMKESALGDDLRDLTIPEVKT